MGNRRRVAIAITAGGIGGGQRVALSIARALARDDFICEFLSPSDGPLLEEARAIGYSTYTSGSRSVADIGSMLSIARELRRSGADLLYTHTVPTHETILTASAFLARVPIVIHRHNVAPFSLKPATRRIQIALWKRAVHRAEEVISVSPQVQSDLLQLTGRTSELVWNGVEVPADVRHPEDDLPTIAFVGRPDPHKGLEDFLEAARLIHQSHPSLPFVVIGSELEDITPLSPERRTAEALCERGVLQFLGPIQMSEDSFRRFSILLMPSRLEGHPLVLLEAMARRKTVIAYSIPGCRETIVHDESGLLVPISDVQALADAAVELATNPKRRETIGSAARLRVETTFSETRMTQEAVALLTSAVSRSGVR